MAKLAIKKASTDVTVYLFIQASNVTTGAGLTGLTFETANLVASYVRPGAARAAITLATLAAADSAHSDGGFKEVDATNMPGIYRLDLPDAVCATGVNSVVVMLKGAANMAPVVLEVQLVSYDPNDGVRLGITALPNAAADEAGGLPISDAGGLDLDAQIGTDIDAILADTGTDGVKVASLANDSITAAALKTDAVDELVDAVWDEAISGHTTATTFGGKNQKVVPSETINDYKADVSALTNVTLAATQTGVTIPTVTSITNGVTLADDAITAAKFDESTAFPVKSADAGGTQIARVGADSDTLETLSGQMDAIKTETAAIVADTGTDGVVLKAAGLDADAVAEIAAGVMASTVEGTYDLTETLRIIAGVLAGKLSGGGTTTLTFRNLGDSLDIVQATVDANGNRSGVIITLA